MFMGNVYVLLVQLSIQVLCQFFKYILLIMLSQLFHFFLPVIYLCPVALLLPVFPPPQFMSWVILIYFLASPFPILCLTPMCLFCMYKLCFLFLVPFLHSLPSPSLLITLHMISISFILFLFKFAQFKKNFFIVVQVQFSAFYPHPAQLFLFFS